MATARGRVCSPLPENSPTASGSPRADFSHLLWHGGFMEYVPRWERLNEARRRVAKAGLSKREIQRDICRAMADGAIKVRPSLELIKETVLDHKIHHRHAHQIAKFTHDLFNEINRYPKPWELYKPFSVPRELKPSDLDWRKSSFKRRFRIAIRPDMAPMLWDVSIELFSRDVTRALIARAKQKMQAGARPAAGNRLTRRSPKREQARIALNELYPDRAPDRNEEPDQILVDKVANLLQKKFGKSLVVAPDTILRAAGRRQDAKGRSRHG